MTKRRLVVVFSIFFSIVGLEVTDSSAKDQPLLLKTTQQTAAVNVGNKPPSLLNRIKEQKRELVRIELPEVYELANIILAISPYGRADEWEVQKGSPYYKEVLSHFLPFVDHPLISNVNYSRDRWEEYLSFRSDAYAFRFDTHGRLERHIAFEANEGVRPFDDHLRMVEDFAQKSGFREFYRKHASYYAQVLDRYAKSYMIKESIDFLKREFGPSEQGEFRIILSPLVLRMNAQRSLDTNTTLSFATPAVGLLGSTERVLSQKERITEIHTLFTEIDHAFVNPATERYAALLATAFDWQRWNNTKDEYGTNVDTFNEYMTWAVFDLFAKEQFGSSSSDTIANWHLQNKGRGFIASELFAAELVRLRQKTGKKVRDLYPQMLRWTAHRQASLTMPVLVKSVDSVPLAGSGITHIQLEFSEPMQPSKRLTLLPSRKDANGVSSAPPLTLDAKMNNFRWSQGNRVLNFDYRPSDADLGFTLNWWDASPLVGISGVYMSPDTKVSFRRNTSQ